MSINLSNLLQQTTPHTFFELLSRYRIAIPCLQRHYVQGENMPKAREVLYGFLCSLFDEFSKDAPKQLHFLFGPLDTHGADTFQPVDGQQRLTTLWLLSRYAVAWLSNAQERASLLQILSRFTYSERIHAERFLKRLTDEKSDDKQWRENPSTAMIKCGILNSGWKEDRTVSAMLNTLDLIASLWRERKPDAAELLTWLWQKLTFHVCMERFSNDLYMKMNARGLPLTQWEKVKGKFAESFDQECNFSERIEKLSNAFFETMTCIPDDAFFALFGRVAHYIHSENRKAEVADDQLVDGLNALAECTWAGDKVKLPHTPFEQFKARRISRNNQLSLLKMMEFLLVEAKKIYLPEWAGVEKCLLAKAVFHPENKHQRDLSLVLFEYFINLKDSNNLNLNHFEYSLRLFWNVLGDGNVTPDEKAPYKRVTVLRDCFIKNSSSLNLYMNCRQPNFSGEPAWQYQEEVLKMGIYQTPSEWPESWLKELHKVEAIMHGCIKIVLADPENSRLCQSRISTLNRLGASWQEALADNNKMQFLLSCVMMAMPYWPKEDRFQFHQTEGTLRALLKMNKIFLASSLLDYLCKNPQAGPKEILINNPFGFSKRDDYQTKQPWRRDWQANLLWVMEKDQIFGKTAQYHKGSDCFYLYANAYVSGAIPLNDYRFDFICNDSLRNELEKFYESVQATVQGMTINESFTHSTIVESNDGRKRHLYFYPDHIAVSYEENGIWSSQNDVKFHDIAGKSILEPQELISRATEFFETIKSSIQSYGA